MRRILPLLLLLLMIAPARAACPSMQAMAPFAQAIIERRAPAPFRDLTRADALCAQDRLIAFFAQAHGDVVGYRIGLTSPAEQQRFGVSAPVRGVIFHGTLREASPARMPADFGAAPVVEAGLLLRIGRDGLERAGDDPLAILRHIDQAVPFIGLSDFAFAPAGPRDLPNLLAINLGARFGVVGAPVALQANAETVRLLQSMTISLATDQRELGRGRGEAVMGHPLAAVAWLVRDMAQEERPLRRGEYVVLGGFMAPAPAEAGRTYTLRVEGLPGAAPVVVTLE